MNNPSTSTAEGLDLVPPPFSRDQIDYLKKVFPDRLPSIDTSDRELGALIGQQRVIRHLDAILREQEEDDKIPHVL